jgi:hypothetical protein
MNTGKIMKFPEFTGIRCLMMPFLQGEPASLPDMYAPYKSVLESVYMVKGAIGFLTIDESMVEAGRPHRGARARHGRALHTEGGLRPNGEYVWGPPTPSWGGSCAVTLDRDVRVLLANSVDNTCAIWDAVHEDTTEDGDIGHAAELYPYKTATLMHAGEVHEVGILTPHESLAVDAACRRQFLRIVSSGVRGREACFTRNPLMEAA